MECRTHEIVLPIADGPGKHRLNFYDWGNVDATQAVVCVHGLTRNAHDFDLLAQELVSRGRRVFALSLAGRGTSEWLADPMHYTYPTYVADCLAILDNFHLRSVDWVGTSMGGIIGMMIAAQRGNRIRKLVLNDVGSKLSKESLRRIYDYVRTIPPYFSDRAAADVYLREVFAPFGITDPGLWHRFVDHSLLAQPQGGYRLACDPAIVEPLRRDTKDFTEIGDVVLTALWEEIDHPTLILHGEQSDVLSADTVRSMKATNPRAESVTIPGVGHAPSLMSPDQIAIVADWLVPVVRGI